MNKIFNSRLLKNFSLILCFFLVISTAGCSLTGSDDDSPVLIGENTIVPPTNIVKVSLNSASEIFGTGDNLDLSVEFANVVTVSGQPLLELAFRDQVRQAVYIGGSNSKILTFRYKISPTDYAVDLDYSSNAALIINSGSITSLGKEISLVLPSPGAFGSLSQQNNVVVDNENPTIYSVFQNMDSANPTEWSISDGWTNGPPFLNGWCQSQTAFNDGIMTLSAEQKLCAGMSYASGEFRSADFFGYGFYSVRMKAAKGSGLVSSFFSYTGPSDGNPHDEIDIEILGKDTSKIQVNYWTNGVEHPSIIELGFDAAADYHTYSFLWTSESITWYADGKQIHQENGEKGPLPVTPGRIMANLWPADAAAWAGSFDPSILPKTASYDWIGFKKEN